MRLGHLYHIGSASSWFIPTSIYKAFYLHPNRSRLACMYDIDQSKNIICKL